MKFTRRSLRLRILAFLQKNAAFKNALLFAILFFEESVQAQTNLWWPAPFARNQAKTAQTPELPDFEKGLLLQLDVAAMQQLGNTAWIRRGVPQVEKGILQGY